MCDFVCGKVALECLCVGLSCSYVFVCGERLFLCFYMDVEVANMCLYVGGWF